MWNRAIIGRAEQWTPLVEGGRKDYACQFKTRNGWFDTNHPQLKREMEEAAA